jgi:hypothetical protein
MDRSFELYCNVLRNKICDRRNSWDHHHLLLLLLLLLSVDLMMIMSWQRLTWASHAHGRVGLGGFNMGGIACRPWQQPGNYTMCTTSRKLSSSWWNHMLHPVLYNCVCKARLQLCPSSSVQSSPLWLLVVLA